MLKYVECRIRKDKMKFPMYIIQLNCAIINFISDCGI